jgi:hypothetical protein
MFGSRPSDSRSSDGREKETRSEEGKEEIPMGEAMTKAVKLMAKRLSTLNM